MREQMPCEQFGTDRSREIDDLIEAATGSPCPGRSTGVCPLSPCDDHGEAVQPHLSVVAS